MSPNLPSAANSSIPNIGTPGSMGQLDEEFKPNAAMEEMIINFLIRASFHHSPYSALTLVSNLFQFCTKMGQSLCNSDLCWILRVFG
jgi:hypothetical protein